MKNSINLETEEALNSPRSHARGRTDKCARVLLVDDDIALLRADTRGLTTLGFAVESFTSPVLALERMLEQPFDVVVTDIAMPEMDGMAFLSKIRARNDNVPAIVRTGTPSVSTRAGSISQGARAYLLKPTTCEQLEGVLKQTLNMRVSSTCQKPFAWF